MSPSSLLLDVVPVIVTGRSLLTRPPLVRASRDSASDGASLTVIEKTDDTFSVSLVEYTQQNTNHLQRKPGDSVNLESDILARYVAQILEARGVIPRADS